MKKGDPGYFQAIIDQRQYNLTFEQQKFIQANAEKFPLVELIQKAFKEDTLNERSVEYDEVRKYVAKIKRESNKITFTSEQIDFIEANSASMKPFELAKTIFPDRSIVPLSAETQLISQYLKAIGSLNSDGKESDEYRPPKAAASLARKINQADSTANFDANDLSPIQKKCIESLRAYLQSIRFGGYMKIFDEADMKEMFEEEFIKGVYDKPDLNSEELNMYINLAAEYVNIHQVHKSKIIIENKINSALTGDGAKDGEEKKLYMTHVDLLQRREDDLHKSKKRAEDLQVKLSSTRSQRLANQAQVNESLSKFVEEWKSSEGRKRILRISEAQSKLASKEIDRLETMEEYIANVFGLSRDEILKN
jgi:hypothetical protein